MAGTFSPKVLGEGQVASSKGTIYTVPASTSAYVKSITFYNTNAATQTLNIYLKPGATSRQIRRVSLAQYESYEFTSPYVLETGDLIEADTTTATAVDYIITGIEET
jgi:hypothetical protein